MVSRVMKDLQQRGLVHEIDGQMELLEDVGDIVSPPLPE
jgi:hypothetical protein